MLRTTSDVALSEIIHSDSITILYDIRNRSQFFSTYLFMVPIYTGYVS